MFLTVHGAVGVIIGQNISNPLLAFLLGLLSHYIFDIIPHGDTKVAKKYKNPIYIGLAAIIDFTLLISWFIFIFSQVQITLVILIALLAAILPDLLQALYYISREKICISCQKMHVFFHNAISNHFELNFYLGIIFQLIILMVLSLIIIL